MATVRLEFSPAPGYVRTARLVGVAVARRAGVAGAVLDEVRQAIGEACGRAVARHRRHGLDDLIRVEMTDEGPYTVLVIDAAPTHQRTGQAAGDEADDTDQMALTLLGGLVDQLQVREGPHGTEVRMVWPTRR
jgi:anti-sigma regulatory factor (Ser/Thr protein kinase)